MIRQDGDKPSVRMSGVCRCDSAGVCPNCAPAKAAKRAAALEPQLVTLEAKGAELWHVVLSLEHGRDDDGAELFDIVLAAWQKVITGKAWAGSKRANGELRPGLGTGLEWVRGLDGTFGGRNGDHPHLHVLLAIPAARGEAWPVVRALLDRWRDVVGTFGRAVKEKGIFAERIASVAAAVAYVAAGGDKAKTVGSGTFEATGSGAKRGYSGGGHTIRELAIKVAEGDPRAAPRWMRAATILKGRRMVTCSAGLSLEMPETEQSEADEPCEVVVFRNGGHWVLERYMAAVTSAAMESSEAWHGALRLALGAPGRDGLWDFGSMADVREPPPGAGDEAQEDSLVEPE